MDAKIDPAIEKDFNKLTNVDNFAELGLANVLCETLERINYKNPTDIQKEAIPYILEGRDVIGLAHTGSGKTAAFLLPILHSLLTMDTPVHNYAVILSPTRELALQIAEQANALGSSICIKVATLVGGVDNVSQAMVLTKKPHIIVATPGRLTDHLETTKGFHLKALKYLVLDEADRLLSMDFGQDILKILTAIPSDRQTLLFSATMTSKVEKLQRVSLRDPIRVNVSKRNETVETLNQYYIFIPERKKENYLVYLLNELQGQSTIIFVSTCVMAQKLSYLLRNLGFNAIPLYGKLPQDKRLGALGLFKEGRKNILIATDVASRGLDIPSVDLVLNYNVPTNSKEYIHRVGRTARAGKSGNSITFVTQYDIESYQKIEHFLGKELETFPTDKEAVEILSDRVSESLRYAVQQLKDDQKDKLRKRKKLK